MADYYIHGINGPVVTVHGGRGLRMLDMVYVGNERLPGEVVRAEEDRVTVQVYEDTGGLRRGEPVYPTGAPLSVTLGPGMMGNIFDGIARPLKKIEEASGAFISRGLNLPALDENRLWQVEVTVKEGDTVNGGDVFAKCQETSAVIHRCMVPPGLSGVLSEVKSSGEYTVKDEIAILTDSRSGRHPITLRQPWPIRRARPFKSRLGVYKPLITGQRVIDTLFPLAKGGCAAIPGPFGAGKTMVQHQLAKWSDADIIIYLGCGERGNEMTQALEEFSELRDPKTGNPLMERTILIANTSNMPVAAREASIYTGMTIAEYYRDMGYNTALMADSTSRWAEALREISGRLEEMPAEEGFPAYLPSRLAEFYERAGCMETLACGEGSVTVIGAVSPQGGDFSEPVTQNTRRFTRCFWALDRSLAYSRHFPAINWNTSYSEYFTDLLPWYNEHLGDEFIRDRQEIISILKEESALMEIVKLIGSDILPEDQKLIIETARVIRLGFLQQNAFHQKDAFMTMENQLAMMGLILRLYNGAKELVARSIPISQLKASGIFELLIRVKYTAGEGDFPREHEKKIDDAIKRVLSENS